jgi:hypothetical protein
MHASVSGVFLLALYRHTGSLWLTITAHALQNFAGSVFDLFPDSELLFHSPVFFILSTIIQLTIGIYILIKYKYISKRIWSGFRFEPSSLYITSCRGQSWDAVHKEQVGYKYRFVVFFTTSILWENTSKNRLFRPFLGKNEEKSKNFPGSKVLQTLIEIIQEIISLEQDTSIPETLCFRDFLKLFYDSMAGFDQCLYLFHNHLFS